MMLDVYPDVFAWGVLLVPKDIKEGERRPVVVCQHGRNGLPKDVIEGDSPAYHDFAARLADRGFVTFAPHNLYRGEDLYRMLNRKGNPLKLSMFSFITAQHRQILKLARHAAVRRRRADRVLRPELRRRDGRARAAACSKAIACRSARATSTTGHARSPRPTATTASCSRSNGRCPTSTWAARSTTPSWPT